MMILLLIYPAVWHQRAKVQRVCLIYTETVHGVYRMVYTMHTLFIFIASVSH